jgi:DNA polymerase III sliding clamp (beta) subunit (PCNA family)
MKISLKTSVLRAALMCAAKKDIRYYLQGVCVSINHPEVAMVYGTNGHILFAGQCPIDVIEAPEALGFDIIIPSDVIKAMDKKANVILLETIDSMPKGYYVLGNSRFQAIEARFPDVSRVVPSRDAFPEQKISYFKPEYLQTANEALAMYYGDKKDKCYPLTQRGDSSGVVHAERNDALVVVMPMRNDPGIYQGLNSDFMQVQQKAA